MLYACNSLPPSLSPSLPHSLSPSLIPSLPPSFPLSHSDGTLRGLYKALQSHIANRTAHSPICIVLDDLSILSSVGVGERDIEGFVQYCVEFTVGPNAVSPVSYFKN